MRNSLAALTVLLGLAVVSLTATQAHAQLLITPDDPASGSGGGASTPPGNTTGLSTNIGQQQGLPPAHARGWGRGGRRIGTETGPVETTTLETAGMIRISPWEHYTLLALNLLRRANLYAYEPAG
jgi:hypothetical protein